MADLADNASRVAPGADAPVKRRWRASAVVLGLAVLPGRAVPLPRRTVVLPGRVVLGLAVQPGRLLPRWVVVLGLAVLPGQAAPSCS